MTTSTTRTAFAAAFIHGISWHISNSVPPTDTYEWATCHVLTIHGFMHSAHTNSVTNRLDALSARLFHSRCADGAQCICDGVTTSQATIGNVRHKNISFGRQSATTMLENRWQYSERQQPFCVLANGLSLTSSPLPSLHSQLTLLTVAGFQAFSHTSHRRRQTPTAFIII